MSARTIDYKTRRYLIQFYIKKQYEKWKATGAWFRNSDLKRIHRQIIKKEAGMLWPRHIFIVEVRKVSGNQFPRKIISQILTEYYPTIYDLE